MKQSSESIQIKSSTSSKTIFLSLPYIIFLFELITSTIVHDWLTNMGGAEQVVINFHEIFLNAPIYTTFYTPEKLDSKIFTNIFLIGFIPSKYSYLYS